MCKNISVKEGVFLFSLIQLSKRDLLQFLPKRFNDGHDKKDMAHVSDHYRSLQSCWQVPRMLQSAVPAPFSGSGVGFISDFTE